MSKITVRDVQYNVVVEGSGPTVFMLHGFTGSIHSWDDLADHLSSHFRTVRIDLLGHGRSAAPDDPERYSLWETAQDIEAIADELEIERFHLLGYSLGGRAALHAALTIPRRVLSLVLESTSPGIADVSLRAERRERDEELAQLLEREGIVSFVDHWEKLPLFATERNLPEASQRALRAERLAHRPKGLANSLRGAGAGVQDYLLPRLKGLKVRTLIVAGELDEKYTALAHQLHKTLPRSTLVIVPEAGHAVHRERPEAFSRAVHGFLREM